MTYRKSSLHAVKILKAPDLQKKNPEKHWKTQI